MNLIRSAHNWNTGMLELWNDGFKENRFQSAYYCIDFLVLMEFFIGQKAENSCLASIIIKCKFKFFVELAVFHFSYPIFQHSAIPTFHAAYQEDSRKKHCDSHEL